MTKSRSLLLFIVFALIWLPASVRDAVAVSEADGPKVFTNEDIERYKMLSDAQSTGANTVFQDDREEGQKDKKRAALEEHEMEYWCKKASACSRKIEEQKETVKEIEDKIFQARTSSGLNRKKDASLQKSLARAKRGLRKAEGDLSDLQEEAHRKGVKPGWLRCQL